MASGHWMALILTNCQVGEFIWLDLICFQWRTASQTLSSWFYAMMGQFHWVRFSFCLPMLTQSCTVKFVEHKPRKYERKKNQTVITDSGLKGRSNCCVVCAHCLSIRHINSGDSWVGGWLYQDLCQAMHSNLGQSSSTQRRWGIVEATTAWYVFEL